MATHAIDTIRSIEYRRYENLMTQAEESIWRAIAGNRTHQYNYEITDICGDLWMYARSAVRRALTRAREDKVLTETQFMALAAIGERILRDTDDMR